MFSNSKIERTSSPALSKKDEVEVAHVETPFDKRYCCWFCGEPSHVNFVFPPNTSLEQYAENKYLILDYLHPTLSVPCCGECQKIANSARESSIWAVNGFVKKQLVKRHAKDLAIGINWTQAELAESGFEQGNFSGFAKSAWFIYEVAKQRVNFIGWPLVVNGITLDECVDEEEQFESFDFDGVNYPTIADAIEHYAKTFSLEQHFFKAVLQHMSKGSMCSSSFAKAVRFCRLLVNATPSERKVAFKSLVSEVEL